MFKYIKPGFHYLLLTAIFMACSEDLVKPILGTEDTYVAPVILSTESPAAVEFTAENLQEEFEVLELQPADYGANVAVKYVVQAAQTEDFATASLVKEVDGSGLEETRSISILNEDINTAMLTLGLAAGEEATVNMRVLSYITTLTADTLYSNAVQRTAIPFRDSECGTYCSVGIIGSATAGGWDIDTDMRLADEERIDRSTWTATVFLNVGEVKFRAMDSWDVNWGAATFPDGTGTAGGANIPIATAGYYKVTFNDQTGAYSFVPAGATTFTSIGLIGEQSSWSNDIGDLTQHATDPHVWTGKIALTAGQLKFRANDSWDNNWGGKTFPSGVGIPGGDNIVVPVSATYFIYLNDATGEYFFGPEAFGTAYNSVGLIGSATANGWDSDTDLTKNPSNPYQYSGKITITDGEAKFRANDAWDVNWGATGFPGGTGALNGANIPVQAGTYFVSFNSATGEYNFLR